MAMMAAGGSENFRSSNVRFLQEQNRQVVLTLEKVEEERDDCFASVQRWEEKKKQVEGEYRRQHAAFAEAQDRVDITRAEIHKRDESIRVLSEQNRSLLEMLDAKETEGKDILANLELLNAEEKRLSSVADEYEQVKANGDRALVAARAEVARAQEEHRNAVGETDQLRTAARNYAEQAKVDIAALEAQLAEAKRKNVDYLTALQHNEVAEHRMVDTIQKLKETLEDLTLQKRSFRLQLDGDEANRESFAKSRAEVERRQETLERTVEALRMSLRSAEDENQRMQEDQRLGAENFKELGDKVYSLMEQLRQNQMELKKQEKGGMERTKKITVLDQQAATLQARVATEVDARLAAEAEARAASQMQALLQKKNKKLEEGIAIALKAQEKVEKRQQELTDKANALTATNEYLATRIDGGEEDKGALRQELRRVEEELRQSTATHMELAGTHNDLEDKVNEIEADKAALIAELEYIKREDMLDATGRTKPILIESNDSKLVERLQINEFMYTAQQARNPVPMLIEKLSHILELLHTAQRQSDLYLQDLQRSNGLLTALRQKNKVLYERTQMCEAWKMKALLRIASNEFELRGAVHGHVGRVQGNSSLYLDGLQYTLKELQELLRVISAYGKEETVTEIRMQENLLDGSSAQTIQDLLTLCPYLKRLDLQRNRLDPDAIASIQGFIERTRGVTTVTVDPGTGDITALSGNQVRIVVHLADQGQAEEDTAGGEASPELNVGAADDFLNTAAGLTSQTRLHGAQATASAPPSAGLAQTQLPLQKGGMGDSRSASTLPRLASTGSPRADPLGGRPGSRGRPGSGRPQRGFG